MTVALHLGDCLDIMKSIPDKSVDAIITDLPYGTTACKWDEIIPFEPMWAQVKRICNGAFVTTASQPFTTRLISSNIKDFRHEWIWQKAVGSNFASMKYMPMKEHENIIVFSSNGHTYNPQKQSRHGTGRERAKHSYISNTVSGDYVGNLITSRNNTTYDKNSRNPSSVQYFNNRDIDRGIHPTQKPVALYEYFIRTYTNEGDTVLDITMGSGTTGVACVQTGRNFIGIEIDPTYYAIAEKRIHDAQQQMRLPL